MRIRALRVAETGCFREAVALEGLSGALDVLAGPNELGKSTLLRALHALLFESYKTTKEAIKELMPYAGGAPLVEADIEIGQALWRVRKRFLQGKAAELRRVGSGEMLRGGDAEQKLEEMLGEAAPALRLLWIGQRESLEPLAPDAGQAATLRGLLSREIEAVAGGRQAQAVLAAATAELLKLLTPATGKPATGGPLKQAIDDCARLEAELADARRARAEAEGRFARLAIARARRQELSDPFVLARLAAEASAARAAVEAAREAGDKARLAHSEWQRLEAERSTATDALDRRQRLARERARLVADTQAAAGLIEARRTASDDAARAAKDADDRLSAARKIEQHVRARLSAAHMERSRARAEAERKEIEERQADARRVGEAMAKLRETIGAIRVSEPLLQRIAAEERSILKLQSRIEAASARLTFALEPGGRDRVRIAGKPALNGETLIATSPVTIEIEGIGRIRLEPGASEERESDTADLAAHESVLAELLASAGAADAAAAATLLESRREAEAHLREMQSRLAALLPGGEPAVAARLATLAAESRRDGPAETEPADVLETRLAAAETERGRAEEDAASARDRSTEARLSLGTLLAAAEERRGRLASLETEIARAPATEPLAETLETATRAANDARRSLDAWREKAPTKEAAASLAQALESASAAESRARADLEANEREIAELNGALGRDRESDLDQRVAELEGELDRARARRERHQRAASELSLIKAAFEAVRAERRGDSVAPVIEAIRPYLGLVLPGATIDLDQHFAAGRLARSGSEEPVARLSQGTREQIAVLARLGFARLLAGRGKPAPLILDDALVYSDDERIARAFEALTLASGLHQVIVLTCRTNSFAALRGKRLEITRWAA
jgi:energy-coupling factor transporter ATP-binding protein EcfA2